VHPILLAIGDVVNQVDDARQHAEDGERADGQRNGLGIEKRGGGAALTEHQRGEDDEIFGPLRRAQRHEETERG
jgi:hypothetical protein